MPNLQDQEIKLQDETWIEACFSIPDDDVDEDLARAH
jgi:hypothetical protein